MSEPIETPEPKPSAQPCGCDFGMTPPHRCAEHQREYEDMIEEALRMCGR